MFLTFFVVFLYYVHRDLCNDIPTQWVVDKSSETESYHIFHIIIPFTSIDFVLVRRDVMLSSVL